MDRIREMLDRMAELSSDELDELESGILAEFDTLEQQDLTREAVDRMNELADAADGVRTERGRREQEAAELASARDEAVSRLRGAEGDADESSDEDTANVAADDAATDEEEEERDEEALQAASVDTPSEADLSASTDPAAELSNEEHVPDVVSAGDEAPAQPETAELQDAASDAVIAEAHEDTDADNGAAPETVQPADESVSTAQSEADQTEENSEEENAVTAAAHGQDIEVPADRRPAARTAPVAITAGADIPGITAGAELPDMRSVADALVKRMRAMGRTSGGDGEQHTIATITASFPDERTLHANDFEGNSTKVEKVIKPDALVAAGGICAPVDVSYDIFGLEGSTARPVRDALAVFSADRGGIRFVTPPTLADLDGAVSVWTLQDDIDAATVGAPDPVKPCLRVDCGNEVVVYTDAIPLCLIFGNLGARAWPELVERHMELAMVQHARFAETRLITRIGSLSTAVTANGALSAARDFFVQLEQAAAGYRNRYRMDSAAPLRVILPEWFRNALRADLVMQLPGDGQDSTFGLADNFMNTWFAVRNINVSWTLDGETGQILGAQAVGALNGFPTSLVWYLFAEGTFLFLDGGTLDLGLVRDSTLNGTNDYKVFLETFEGVAKVGVESLRVTTTLRIEGASAGTVDTHAADNV